MAGRRQINTVIKKNGKTQKEVAELIGMTNVGLNKALARGASAELLEQIAHAIGVPVTAFLQEGEQTFDNIDCGSDNNIQFGNGNTMNVSAVEYQKRIKELEAELIEANKKIARLEGKIEIYKEMLNK